MHSAEVAYIHLLKSHLCWCCEFSLPRRDVDATRTLSPAVRWFEAWAELSRALAPAVTPKHHWGTAACLCCSVTARSCWRLCQQILRSWVCFWDSLKAGKSHQWTWLCSITVKEFIGENCENQLAVNEKKVVSTSIYYECFSCSFRSVACTTAIFITKCPPVYLRSTGQTDFKLLLQ